MIKVILTFALLVGLLLSKSYADGYQKAQQQLHGKSLTGLLEKARQGNLNHYKTSLSKENAITYAEENEDEDWVSTSKTGNIILISAHLVVATHCLASYQPRPLPFSQYSSYTSTSKYILNNVFRI